MSFERAKAEEVQQVMDLAERIIEHVRTLHRPGMEMGYVVTALVMVAAKLAVESRIPLPVWKTLTKAQYQRAAWHQRHPGQE